MDVTKLLEQALHAPTVFTDERVFDSQYLPDSLPFREQQFQTLTNYFRSLILGEQPSHLHVILHGPVGVGKTTTMKLFGNKAAEFARIKSRRNLVYVHLNCRRYRRSSYQATKAIITQVIGPMAPRGYSTGELIEKLQHYLELRNIHLLVALDEAEYLISHDIELLNYLLKLKDSASGKNSTLQSYGASVALIVREQHLEMILDPATASSLQHNFIFFPPYTPEQLDVILRERIQAGLKPGTIDHRVRSFIAEIAAAHGGDCRLALEILYRAGKLADEQQSDYILNEHVRLAAASIHQTEKNIIRELSFQHQMILLSLVRLLKRRNEQHQEVTFPDLEEEYGHLCASKDLPQVQKTRTWEIVQDLVRLGLVNKKVAPMRSTTTGRKSKRRRGGRITYLNITGELPLDELEQELDRILKMMRQKVMNREDF